MAFTDDTKTEGMIAAKLEYEFRMRDAQYFAYPPVVGGGRNSIYVHYLRNSAKLKYLFFFSFLFTHYFFGGMETCYWLMRDATTIPMGVMSLAHGL